MSRSLTKQILAGNIRINKKDNIRKNDKRSLSEKYNPFLNITKFFSSTSLLIDITLSKEILMEIENIHLSDPNPCV